MKGEGKKTHSLLRFDTDTAARYFKVNTETEKPVEVVSFVKEKCLV